MATYDLTTTDLNEHAVDANQVIDKAYTDIPLTYRVKEVVIQSYNTTAGINAPNYGYEGNRPIVTLSAPPAGGVQATAAGIITYVDATTGGIAGDSANIQRFVVTNPGSGYTSAPTVSLSYVDGTGSHTDLYTQTVVVMEVDPICIAKRQQLVESINTQIIEEHLSLIKEEVITIDNHMNRLQSVVEDIVISQTDDQGNQSEFVAGPHIRNIATGWDNGYGGGDNTSIARAMMMVNLKETDKLDEVSAEMTNPTPLP
jgi:hypothetical protein